MRHPLPAALVLPFLPLLAALLPAEGPPPPGPVYLLDRGGQLFSWRAGETTVRPESIPWQTINDLVTFEGGNRLLILTTGPSQAADRHRRSGLAVVLDSSGPALKALHQVPFDGLGLRGAVTPDGRRAYVLATRVDESGKPARHGRSEGPVARSWLHEIDLRAGQVTDSDVLGEAALALAVDPDGRRIYVAGVDRILSYTTSPLVSSWYYRSPGLNLGLAFRRGGDVLYAARGREVALFDPRLIAARTEDERRGHPDDATRVLPVGHQVAAIIFSADGLFGVAFGGTGRLTYFDATAAAPGDPAEPDSLPQADLVRPILFPAAPGDLLVAAFPSREVEAVRGPRPVPPVAAQPQPVATLPAPELPTPSRTSTPEPGVGPTPIPPPDDWPATDGTAAMVRADPPGKAVPGSSSPADSQAPRAATSGPAPGPSVLRGRLTGDRERVAAIVLYGPDDILREQSRVAPGPEGVWEMRLPPPGTYRIVPVAAGLLPLRVAPKFRTIVVRGEEARDGLDFVIGDRSP